MGWWTQTNTWMWSQRKVIPYTRETFFRVGGVSAISCFMPCIKKSEGIFQETECKRFKMAWAFTRSQSNIKFIVSCKISFAKPDCATMTKLRRAIIQVWYRDQKNKRKLYKTGGIHATQSEKDFKEWRRIYYLVKQSFCHVWGWKNEKIRNSVNFALWVSYYGQDCNSCSYPIYLCRIQTRSLAFS